LARVRPRSGVSRRCGRCQTWAPWYDRGEGARRWRALGISQLDVMPDGDPVEYTERVAELVPSVAAM
jgi:transposase